MMRSLLVVLSFLLLSSFFTASAFVQQQQHQSAASVSTTTEMSASSTHPFCDLPGDPSLILTTNVDLGAKKMEIMKDISKAISVHTGKPESYIGT